MNQWDEDILETSPYTWILKLSEEEYLNKINSVLAKYEDKKIDKRYLQLKNTGLFSDKTINKFMEEKI